MGKAAVIYWSSTGNTEAMAKAVFEGAKDAGADVELFEVTEISADAAAKYDALALGCPAMGDEQLEEGDFEPFFTDLEKKIGGKSLVLFGSYDWGDGDWMRTWYDRCKSAGAALLTDEGLICNNTPDDDGLAACKELGAKLA
ncbi:MAG: flavodoxin [Blautia sp.]|nr:flavodoxin [Blautia sp.]